jgi:cytochrome P450
MHRRKDIWGEDADDFVPERWEKKKVGWEFLPVSLYCPCSFPHVTLRENVPANESQFNGGPRICIGQQFALTEASYVIVRLMQRFDKMENQDFTDKAQHNLTLTSCSGTGVKVTLHEAEE